MTRLLVVLDSEKGCKKALPLVRGSEGVVLLSYKDIFKLLLSSIVVKYTRDE